MPNRDLPTSIRFPPELRKWLLAFSKEQRRSLSGLVVWVLEQYRKHAEMTRKK